MLIIALIPLRWNILPMMFTAKELSIMDGPTADNDVVLASLGGKPRMPEDKYDEDAKTEGPGSNQSSNDMIARKEEDKWSAAERAVPREGMRERVRGWRKA